MRSVNASGRWSIRGLCALCALVVLAFSDRASAQQDHLVPPSNGDGMDTHLFRPAVDSKGFFSVNGSDIVGANDISFGLILDYGRNILRTNKDRVRTLTYEGRGASTLIRDSFQGTLSFNYGIANMLVVGVAMPVVLMAGDAANDLGPGPPGNYNTGHLDAQKPADVSLHAKLRITRVNKGLGLAAVVEGGVPTGNAPRDAAADPGVWYWPQAVVEKRFGATGALKLGLNAGYRGHTGKNPQFYLDQNNMPELAEGKLEYGNLATFGLGLAYRATDSVDLVAETYGTYLLDANSDAKQKLSQEVVGGLKLFVEHNSYLMIGGGSRYGAVSTGFEAADARILLGFVFEPSIGDRDGDGIMDDVDQCPDQPEDFDGFLDEDGCPDPDNDNDGVLDVNDRCPNVPGPKENDGCPEANLHDRDGDGILDKDDKCPDQPEDKDGFQDQDGCPDLDNDKDGIPDKDDQCPNQAEDKDGFQDEDGCPDPDNDNDQIPDVKDKCPNKPETYNGFQDEDGCPDKGKVIIEGSDIVILDKVQFKTASAEILPASKSILDAVAATLKGHPEFKVVEIAGHADERGNDNYNLKLTRDRAHSVLSALVSRGISRNRLVSQGYGEYCPLKTGHTPAAWEKNRRVEFKVVKTEDGMTDVERGCAAATSHGVKPPPVK